MKLLAAVFLFVLPFSLACNAQNMIAYPVDEAAKDPSFLAYRNSLIRAVDARDTESVIRLASEDILISFGGNGGHAELRDFLNVPVGQLSDDYKPLAPQMRAEHWRELETVLKLGGRFDDGTFSAPYTWTADYPEEIDSYSVFFVMGESVLMRSSGNSAGSVVDRLSYNVVAIHEWQEDSDYQAIQLPDGKKGYISSKYLRALIDYRAVFAKTAGNWEMTYFIAGD